MLKEASLLLLKGIREGEYELSVREARKGRFPEEENFFVWARHKNLEAPLLFIKVFYGRGFYRPWVEFYGMRAEIAFGAERFSYFDSPLEQALFSLFGQALSGGENFFVEYSEDTKTRQELLEGVPPFLTRLGFKLFTLGFSWFKDWYISEGGKEGGLKLQTSKPRDLEVERRRERKWKEELALFLEREEPGQRKALLPALERARALLSSF